MCQHNRQQTKRSKAEKKRCLQAVNGSAQIMITILNKFRQTTNRSRCVSPTTSEYTIGQASSVASFYQTLPSVGSIDKLQALISRWEVPCTGKAWFYALLAAKTGGLSGLLTKCSSCAYAWH